MLTWWRMTIKITKLDQPDSRGSQFFCVLIEGDGMAIVIPGWKIFDNKIFPPSKEWKRNFYSSALASPGFCKAVQTALEEQGFEGLDEESWVSAKWGQAGLKTVMATAEDAIALWERYTTRRKVFKQGEENE